MQYKVENKEDAAKAEPKKIEVVKWDTDWTKISKESQKEYSTLSIKRNNKYSLKYALGNPIVKTDDHQPDTTTITLIDDNKTISIKNPGTDGRTVSKRAVLDQNVFVEFPSSSSKDAKTNSWGFKWLRDLLKSPAGSSSETQIEENKKLTQIQRSSLVFQKMSDEKRNNVLEYIVDDGLSLFLLGTDI